MKKKIPLEVLEILEPFIQKKGTYFQIIEPNNCLLRFKDNENNSDFYFNIEQYKYEKEFKLLISWKPQSKQSVENAKTWITGKQLESYFSLWLNLLKGYEKVNSAYDDPIVEAFSEEYFAEFEILEEDAEIKPLTIKQILLLDKHLENIEENIERFQTESNKNEIQQIKQDVIDLRNNLTKRSKKWIVKNLTNIWAKMTKEGTKLLKEFLSETKKHTIKEGVRVLIDKGIDLIS